MEEFRAGGKGGQHQNKTNTGVRITHEESGFSSECRETRSKLENRKRAFNKLAPKIVSWWRKLAEVEREAESEQGETKSVLTQTSRQERDGNRTIRTYNYADNRIVDHDSGAKYSTATDFEKIVADRFSFFKKKQLDELEE